MNAFDEAIEAQQRRKPAAANAALDKFNNAATKVLREFADSMSRRGVPTDEFLIWPTDPNAVFHRQSRGDTLLASPPLYILEGWPIQYCKMHSQADAVGIGGQAIHFREEEPSYSREVVRALGREVIVGVRKPLWGKPITEYGNCLPWKRGFVVDSGNFLNNLGEKFLVDAAVGLVRGTGPGQHSHI